MCLPCLLLPAWHAWQPPGTLPVPPSAVPWDREGAHTGSGGKDSAMEDMQPELGTLLRAVTPVRMMWEFSTWMTRWPSLTR